MKKYVFLLLLFSSPTLWGQKAFTIEGEIEGLSEGAMVYLVDFSSVKEKNFENLDSVKIIDGQFKIEGITEALHHKRTQLDIYLGKLRIHIYDKKEGETKLRRVWLVFKDENLPFTGIMISLSSKKETKVIVEGSTQTSPKGWTIKSDK